MFVAGAIMGYIMFTESTLPVHTELTPKSCGFQDCSLDYGNCSSSYILLILCFFGAGDESNNQISLDFYCSFLCAFVPILNN
ncbi:Nuclear pore complex protein NUP155 [Zea mays]|uniref:Nuclear pore complex protein NUP155 n=1 Tax=Zea mays TaxID=4577 RepID=A0A1D6LRX5_MAIZE|nr:Nuclear pore complex protein NUP155 [Zea mays]